MKILKQIFVFTILSVLIQFNNSKNLKESTKKLIRSNDGSSNGTEPVKPIIRKTVKPKDKSKNKRVTFSDQILDSTIGTDPLDAKSADRKCTQEKLKTSSAGIKNNSFNKYSIPLFWILYVYFVSFIFTIF